MLSAWICFPVGKLIKLIFKSKIIFKKVLNIERTSSINLCGQLLNFPLRFGYLISFKITEKKILSVFFFPKSNNDIYEKVFQEHNNDIMSVWERGREEIEMDDNSHGFHFYLVPATMLFKIDSSVYQDASLHPKSKTSK